MAFELSKQEIVKEIVKSGKDPIYFINTYCRISHPQRGLIKFDTYPYQDDLLQDFNDFRFTVILKARQLGISTITAAYIVWLINFHRDKNVMVLATKFATAANLVKKVKNVMKNLPEHYDFIAEDGKNIILFDHPDELATTLNQVMENLEFRKNIGGQARKSIIEKGSFEKIWEQFNAILFDS